MRKKVHSYIAGGVANQCSHSGEQWRFLRKLGIDLRFDPAIPLLVLYPKDLKSAYYRDSATSMFTAAQITIARLWKKPRACGIGFGSDNKQKLKEWQRH